MFRHRRSPVLSFTLMFLAFAVGIAPRATAHDLGAVELDISITSDARCLVTIIVDQTRLPASLTPMNAPYQVLEHGQLAIDGVPLKLTPQGEPTIDPAPPHDISLVTSGDLPEGARALTWRCDLPLGQYLVRFKNATDLEPTIQWSESGDITEPFALHVSARRQSFANVAVMYLRLGFTHIVPKGLDHILFVLGLFLLSTNWRPLLVQITAFTLAHSVTLALSIFNVVRLSPSIVEPLIALSIAFVAIENFFSRKCSPWRTAVVFGFGLLHGLGFAGVLTELGLPRSQFVPALVFFNIGVELGQLAVIAGAFLLVGAWFGKKPWYRARITIPCSIVIACIGLYWTVQRVAGW